MKYDVKFLRSWNRPLMLLLYRLAINTCFIEALMIASDEFIAISTIKKKKRAKINNLK